MAESKLWGRKGRGLAIPLGCCRCVFSWFCLCDSLSDALKGSMSVEEVNDTPPQETPPHTEACGQHR